MVVTRFALIKWDPMSVHAQMVSLFSQITEVVQVRVTMKFLNIVS